MASEPSTSVPTEKPVAAADPGDISKNIVGDAHSAEAEMIYKSAAPRRFNHDLLLRQDDQQYAKETWGSIQANLIDGKLTTLFEKSETAAKRLKKLSYRSGTLAIILAAIALLDLCIAMLPPTVAKPSPIFSQATNFAALASLIVAYIASRHGPFRRAWLIERYKCEILRQWHFRQLLSEYASFAPQRFESDQWRSLIQRFMTNTIPQDMDRTLESGHDPLGNIPTAVVKPTETGSYEPKPSPSVPTDPPPPTGANPHAEANAPAPTYDNLATNPSTSASHEERQKIFLDAYYELRIRHQLEFFSWKVGIDGKSFAGLSNLTLIKFVDLIASFSLVASLLLGTLSLLVEIQWSGEISVLMLIIGVAIRAWSAGLGIKQEHELYGDLRTRFLRLQDKWHSTSDPAQRLSVALEAEQAAAEELRSFLRIHEPATFIF